MTSDLLDLMGRGFSFHDVIPLALSIEAAGRVILRLEDLNENWADLPEYPGQQPGRLVFMNGTLQELHIDFAERSAIYDLTVQRMPNGRVQAEIALWPSGIMKIECDQAIVELEKTGAGILPMFLKQH